jgi:hypothetical protein
MAGQKIEVMAKEQKVNYIKGWLQKFGNRNNETFYTKVSLGEEELHISLQYNFRDEREVAEPLDLCVNGYCSDFGKNISDRTEKELGAIVKVLDAKHNRY